MGNQDCKEKMTFNNPYWSSTTKIQMLEQWVLVHSYLYYELDTPIINDYQFDVNSHQLAKAIEKFPKAAEKTRFSYCFQDFDGSTGHHLFGLLKKEDKSYIRSRAHIALALINKRI